MLPGEKYFGKFEAFFLFYGANESGSMLYGQKKSNCGPLGWIE